MCQYTENLGGICEDCGCAFNECECEETETLKIEISKEITDEKDVEDLISELNKKIYRFVKSNKTIIYRK